MDLVTLMMHTNVQEQAMQTQAARETPSEYVQTVSSIWGPGNTRFTTRGAPSRYRTPTAADRYISHNENRPVMREQRRPVQSSSLRTPVDRRTSRPLVDYAHADRFSSGSDIPLYGGAQRESSSVERTGGYYSTMLRTPTQVRPTMASEAVESATDSTPPPSYAYMAPPPAYEAVESTSFVSPN